MYDKKWVSAAVVCIFMVFRAASYGEAQGLSVSLAFDFDTFNNRASAGAHSLTLRNNKLVVGAAKGDPNSGVALDPKNPLHIAAKRELALFLLDLVEKNDSAAEKALTAVFGFKAPSNEPAAGEAQSGKFHMPQVGAMGRPLGKGKGEVLSPIGKLKSYIANPDAWYIDTCEKGFCNVKEKGTEQTFRLYDEDKEAVKSIAGVESELAATSKKPAMSYSTAYAQALADKKPKILLVYVKGENCPACVTMQNETIIPMQESGKFNKLLYSVINIDDPKEKETALQLTQNIVTKPQTVVFAKVRNGDAWAWKRFSLVGMQSEPRINELIKRAQDAIDLGEKTRP